MLTPLPAGKLPPALLTQLLQTLPTRHPQLMLGPAVGEDAAVIDFAAESGRLLVVKSDPITFASDEIGYYAVNVCANDLAVTGAQPRFYLPTILLPASQANGAMAARIFQEIGSACRGIEVVVAGGHSEITGSVSQPVVAGTMLGEVARGKMVSSGGASPGELILLAGGAAIEGTSIIAREKRSELLQKGWSAQELDEAAGYLHHPGISVLKPALLAADRQLVTAMHDPTEGGVATALIEIATTSQVGIEVNLDAIPITELTKRLCAAFSLNPLGTIASGALLATARREHVAMLLACWESIGWSASVIGEVREQGRVAFNGTQVVEFPHFAVDEITKLWL